MGFVKIPSIRLRMEMTFGARYGPLLSQPLLPQHICSSQSTEVGGKRRKNIAKTARALSETLLVEGETAIQSSRNLSATSAITIPLRPPLAPSSATAHYLALFSPSPLPLQNWHLAGS